MECDEGDGGSDHDDNPSTKKKAKTKYLTTALNAPRCHVKQFFLRIDFNGQELPENKWRCVLCSTKSPNDLNACVFVCIEGNTPLHKHLLDSHGVKVLDEGAREAEKKKKKLVPIANGQTQLGFARVGSSRPSTPHEVAVAVAKLVVLDMHAFSMADSESFQELKTVLRGHATRQPDARKVRELVDAEEARLRKVMMMFFEQHLTTYALSGDGKKAEIKGRPMYGVCLHAISNDFDPIVAPLFVGETDSKDALGTKRFILRVCGTYKLSAQKISAFTGDEAEGAAGRLLGCSVLKCAPHRLSTAVKRTFDALDLLGPDGLVDSTKKVVQFLQRRYKARQFSDEVRNSINRDRALCHECPILGLTEFSKTRFLGALLMGKRAVMNWPVIQEADNYALLHASEDPWSKYPGFKERHILEWEDIDFITHNFVQTIEHLSGEFYPTLSDLASSIQLLKTRVWRLGWRPETAQGREQPLDRRAWKSVMGQPFAEQLHTEIEGKFDEDFTNPMVLVATLLDPRYRTFKHPIRGESWTEEYWKDYQSIFTSLAARKIDQKTLDTRMLTAAVDLYRQFFPALWENDLRSLPRETQAAILDEQRMDLHPFWTDLKSWYSTRPVNLTCGGVVVGEHTNPIDFWRECNTFGSLKPLAQIVLNIPVSALTIERFWSSEDKVNDKRRNRLEIETAGRLIYIRHVWKTARAMLDRYGGKLSQAGKAFYEALLPFAAVESL